jgi:hypothetical protein
MAGEDKPLNSEKVDLVEEAKKLDPKLSDTPEGRAKLETQQKVWEKWTKLYQDATMKNALVTLPSDLVQAGMEKILRKSAVKETVKKIEPHFERINDVVDTAIFGVEEAAKIKEGYKHFRNLENERNAKRAAKEEKSGVPYMSEYPEKSNFYKNKAQSVIAKTNDPREGWSEGLKTKHRAAQTLANKHREDILSGKPKNSLER